MGLSKPVHVLQTGAEVNDIVNVAAVAVVDAQESGKYSAVKKPLPQEVLVESGVQ